jgi:hypothetical protein
MYTRSGRGAFVHWWLILAAVTLVAARASAQEIAVAPRLRTGDEFRLEVKRARQNSARPQQDSTSTTMVDVRVIAAAPTGVTLDWVPGDTTFDNSQVAQDPVFAAASEALEGLRLRINLNAAGEFAGLANQAEVAPKLQAAIDIVVRDAMAKLPEEQRKTFQSFVSSVLSPATLVATATTEAQTYFSLHGVTIAVGRPVEAPVQTPSPLGAVVAATFRIRAESATDDSAVLTTTTTYDPAALRDLTRSLASQAGAPIPAAELDKLPPIEMGDDGKFVFDRSVGLMREVVVNRRVEVGPMRRFDGWEIRLVQPPVR